MVVLAVWAYMYYVKPLYLFNEEHTLELNFSPNDSCIITNDGNGQPFSLEIDLQGKTSAIIDLIVRNENDPVHSIAIKGPEIDYTYKSEWYSDTCKLVVHGRSNAEGTLTVRYRFLKLD